MSESAVFSAKNRISDEAETASPSFFLKRKLVIVSNREPYTITRQHKALKVEKSMGGLVSALDPVMRENKGLWICAAPGNTLERISFQDLNRLAATQNIELPYRLHGVSLSEKEVNHYYNGFANRQLWPNFHYFPGRYHDTPEDWQHYFSANQKFAHSVLAESLPEDLIWIHDYHLLLVPELIRQQDERRNIGFFCHIPFPNYEVFRILPRRTQLLKGMLGSDLVGFHIPSYADNFLDCVHRLLNGEAEVNFSRKTVTYQGRTIQVDAFPIGIDFPALHKSAESLQKTPQLAKFRNTFKEEFIGIGVDRLDYTKGILERLEAISHFFEHYPEYRKRLVFIQIAVPTRSKIREYQQMKEDLEQAVGRINGRFSEGSWSPIQYLYRSFPIQRLISYYMIADFALVTPLRDGMNLVAKEYCAAKTDGAGTLILSELAGAAHQMKEALVVNPYNKQEVADTLNRALKTPLSQKKEAMNRLQQRIAKEDIQAWLKNYLMALEAAAENR